MWREGDTWKVRFRSGRHREFWKGNVVAVGKPFEQGEANVLLVEVAPNVQVRVVRHTVADQLNKPVLSNDNQSAAPTAGIGGFLGKLLGKK